MMGKKSAAEFLSGPEFFNPNLIIPLPEPSIDERDKTFGVCMVTEDIDLQVLYSAYVQGIFPWFNEDDGDPVIWCSPDPRFCIWTDDLHISRSIDRFLKHSPYTYTMDRDFRSVIEGCREVSREDQSGTWIGDKIIRAYCELHEVGIAHSFEVWEHNLILGFRLFAHLYIHHVWIFLCHTPVIRFMAVVEDSLVCHVSRYLIP